MRDGDSETHFISAEQLSALFPTINLKAPQNEIKLYEPQGDEIWLLDQVLDRQIVGTEGRWVVRVMKDWTNSRFQNAFAWGLTGVIGLAMLVLLISPILNLSGL